MAPRNVVVVGAGMVGLATAWHLQEEGVRVVVIDAVDVAGGSSSGNAGWVAPSLTGPLNHPALLAAGVKAALSPGSPVYIPPTASPRLARFLTQFVRNSTPRKFDSALRLFIEANRHSVAAFEHLLDSGVKAVVRHADPLMVAFSGDQARKHTLEEFDQIRELGGTVTYQPATRAEALAVEPGLGPGVTSAILLHGQRFLDPLTFVQGLADSIVTRGGTIRPGLEVVQVGHSADGVSVRCRSGEVLHPQAVVLATGASLNRLARFHGVRTIVQAGRGYSFSVRPKVMPRNPIYLPGQRVACTPLGDRLRVAGMMEFRRPDAPLDRRRIRAIVDAARPMLAEADWHSPVDQWVGSRPCTPDGLPLVGRTKNPHVYVAGGHGMWGIALGPLTGQLLAKEIVAQATSPLLTAFDPLR
jgi:D-amino-acid dehydrogenase